MLTFASRIVLVFGVSVTLAAQELVTVIRGPGPFSYFGYGVFPAGDIDRDGAQDIIATTIATQLHPRSRVFFCSGRTGWAMGRVAEEYLAGHTIIPLGDVDGDGYPEVAIPSYSSAEPYVFSPWFGRMHSLQGATEFMAPAGDFDHDGVQDVFAVQIDGRIAVSSGRTGQRIRVFTFGFSPAINAFVGLGDVNGDGVHDFATSKTIGGIEVRSGANETLIANFFTTCIPSERMPLFALGDLDRDGANELAYIDCTRLRLVVASVRTRSVLFEVNLTAGSILESAPMGDLNQDGYHDFMVRLGVAPIGYVNRVYSGRTRSLMYEIADGDVSSCTSIGDVNGDGLAEFALGGYVSSTPFGAVHIFGAVAGTFSEFGVGCPGTAGVPRLSAPASPRVGEQFEVRVANLVPFSFAVLLIGASNTSWGPLPLPAVSRSSACPRASST